MEPLVYQVIKENWFTRHWNKSAPILCAIVTFVLVLISLVYSRNIANAQTWMAASKAAILDGELWRLWTSLFAHGDEQHLLSNSFLFFILGTVLIGYFGLTLFPLIAFLSGGIINWIVLQGMPENIKLIGVSGVVFWMGGVWLTLYFLIERRKSLFQRILRTLGVGLALFVPAEAFNPEISYKSHFVGFVFGLLVGISYFIIHRQKFRAAEYRETVVDL